MSAHPLAVWRRFALPYADPAHDPDWSPPAQPKWPGAIQSAGFRSWVADRVQELEARALRDFEQHVLPHFGGERPSPEQALEKVFSMLPPEARGQFMTELRMAQRTASDPLAIMKQMLRFDEPPRRGPTAIPELLDLEPKGKAGWEIWMLRKVVLPRFWPVDASGDFRLSDGELAKVAASRHKCTPKQAERFYVDHKLASHDFKS